MPSTSDTTSARRPPEVILLASKYTPDIAKSQTIDHWDSHRCKSSALKRSNRDVTRVVIKWIQTLTG